MTVIPPRQYHTAGKCFLKPGEALFYLQAFPFVPGSLICEITFLLIFNLYDIQKIIGVPDHVLAECTALFGFFIDDIPCFFYAVKGHDLP